MKHDYKSAAGGRYAVAAGMAAVLTSLPSLGAEPDLGMRVGAADFYPSISLTEIYDDNIFRTDTATRSSLISVLAPSALIELDGETHAYRIAMDLERGWYHDSPADNYLDRHLGATAEYDPSPRFLASLTLDYLYGHEARGTGANEGAAATGVPEPDEFTRRLVGVKLRYGVPEVQGASVIEVNAAYLAREYQNNRASTQFRDRDEARLSAQFSHHVSPVTALLVEGRVHRFNYDVGLNDNTEYAALVGARWDVTELTTGYAKVGWKRKRFSEPGFDNDSGGFWETGVRWKPLTYSVFGLTAARETEESNGTGDYIDTRSLTLSWDHEWRSFLRSALEVGLVRQDYPGDPRSDDIRSLALRVSYAARWWLSMEAGYAYAERDSNTAGLDFTDNQFSLGLRVAL